MLFLLINVAIIDVIRSFVAGNGDLEKNYQKEKN